METTVLKSRYICGIYHAKIYIILGETLADVEEGVPKCFGRTEVVLSDEAMSGHSGRGDFYIGLAYGFDHGHLNHEISNVVDLIFDYIGEDKPGSECRAYLVQDITDFAHRAFKKWGYESNFKQLFDICQLSVLKSQSGD